MKVAVLGAGAREHAILWKLKEGGVKLFSIPGNGGTSSLSQRVRIGLEKESFGKIKDFLKKEAVELVVIGPEAPLVEGITDYLEAEGFMVFGPSAKAALLEGSKVFAKEFAARNGVNVPSFKVFSNAESVHKFVERSSFPLVIKADGLCAGKGSFVCRKREEAEKVIEKVMEEKIFGESGDTVLVEEFIEGRELSLLLFMDGERFYPMPPCQDYKRLLEEDKGPNTGGMGSYAPVVWVDEELWHTLEQKMIIPTIRGLQKEGIFYKGVLYLGLIINDGVPYLLEYNARWGDPEAQALLPLLETPLLELILSLIEGRSFEVIWSKKACVCIVLASDGYPFSYKKGMLIEGLQEAEKDALIFHAGTEKEGEQFFTTGGRVLSVVGVGEDLRSARKKAYDACALINFDGMHYRRDIADVGEG